MRVLLDANVLLDCLVLESDGLPRAGKEASEKLLHLCDSGTHQGLVAWHTLPILAYYHGRQNNAQDTAAMMDMAAHHARSAHRQSCGSHKLAQPRHRGL